MKLYEFLERKNVLPPEMLQLLMFIHQELRIGVGREARMSTTTGVPQGLTTSPLLFNLYTEELIERLEKEQYWVRMFADDLVLIVENRSIAKSLRIVEAWS